MRRDGNLAPAVWNTLSNLPEECFHHDVHRLRHPRSIYRTSLQRVASQYSRVLDEYERSWLAHFLSSERDLKKLLDAHRDLLVCLHEHFDASAQILRTLCTLQKPTTYDGQYLEQLRVPGWPQYRQAMQPYAGLHVGLIVNRIKHRGQHLEWIYFEGENEFRPGYYLCGIQKGGVLGPDPSLHPGGNSGISFTRELLVSIWWIYRNGELLRNAILAALGMDEAKELKAATVFEGDQDLRMCLERLSGIRILLLPGELRAPCPRICFDAVASQVTLEMPGFMPSRLLPKRLQVHGSVGGIDSEHRTYKLPYFGKDAQA